MAGFEHAWVQADRKGLKSDRTTSLTNRQKGMENQ